MSKFTLTPAHYKKFFATMNRAVARLGLRDEDAKGYYHLVLKEVAHCGSIKTISSAKLYDDCILRFLSDAGEYAQAIDYDQEKVKRYAYVIKVITHQIMQLQRLTPETARAYFDGVVSQSCQGTVGFYSDGERFYLDITIPNLLLFVKILDTHLRRLKRRYFPTFPLGFNDRIRYVGCDTTTGELFLREDVEKGYYSGLPFSVKIRGQKFA